MGLGRAGRSDPPGRSDGAAGRQGPHCSAAPLAQSRTNVGLFTTGGRPAKVIATVLDAAAVAVGTTTYTLPAEPAVKLGEDIVSGDVMVAVDIGGGYEVYAGEPGGAWVLLFDGLSEGEVADFFSQVDVVDGVLGASTYLAMGEGGLGSTLPESQGLAGDATGDGMLSGADVMLAIQEIFDNDGSMTEHRAAQGQQPAAMVDSNADYVIDVRDLGETVGLIDEQARRKRR